MTERKSTTPLAFLASWFSRTPVIASLLLLILPGINALAGPGTWIAVQKFESSMGDYEFIAHIREHKGMNTAEVNIPTITSDATDQPVIQARVVYTTGINTPVNSPGTVHTNWTDVGTMNSSGVLTGATIEVQETLWDPVQLEVRIKGTSIDATMPQQKFHAGTSIVLDGQSDVQGSFRFGSTNNINPPALARDGNVQFIYFHRDNQGDPNDPNNPVVLEPLNRWTLTSSTDRKWRTAPGVLVANMLHQLKPGRQFLITIPAMNGMGLNKQLLHTGDARTWEHEKDISESARLGGFHPGLIHYLVSSDTGSRYCEAIGPLLFGKDRDGSEFEPGDTFTWTELDWIAPETFNHLYTELWDRDKIKLLVSCPWNSDYNDPDRGRKSELIRKHMIEKPAYQQYLSGTGWSYNFVSYWKDWNFGGGHPSKDYYEGAAQSARHMVHAVLGEGNVTSPVIARMVDAQWSPLGQDKYVVLGTDHGPITTWRRILGEPRESGSAEVLGFYIDGAPAQWASIRDINGNLADQGYIWLEKNDKSDWTGAEEITRAPSFTWKFPTPSNTHDETNSDIFIDRGYDGVMMDWPGVASGPSEIVPLGVYGDAADWAEYDTGPLDGGTSSNNAPYGGTPAAIPGKIEVENYDTGGQDIAYSDTTSGNTGSAYRTDDVDLEATSDTGGGYNLAWIIDNEWVEYTVNVQSAGTYDLKLRVARNTSGSAAVRVLFNGSDVSGSIALPYTGGWQTYTTVTVTGVQLNAGMQTMRLTFETGSVNCNWVEFVAQVSPQSPYGGTAAAIPGKIEVENYDSGGQNIAYNDTTSGNTGSAYRFDDVDIEATSDTGGGYNLAWIVNNEWVEYTVNVQSAGTYDLNLRVARSTSGSAAVRVRFDGSDVSGLVALPQTGGWQTYTTVTVTGVQLNAGTQTMRLTFETGGINCNWVEFVAQSGGGGPAITETITASGEDIQVDENGSAAWVGKINARVGNGANTTTRTVYVMPFELPELPSGYSVQSATLDLNLEAWNNWSGHLSGADLYGISVVSSSATPNTTTTYVDGSNPSSNANAQLISDDLLTASLINTSSSSGQTIPVTSANFASFVQSLYDGGAQAGDYVFLTLAHDNTLTAQRYFEVSTANSTTYAKPELTLELTDGGGSGGGITETTTANGETADIGINANLGTRWVGDNYVRVGNSYDSTVRTVMVIPFELPALSSGHTVQSATLELNLEGWNNWSSLLSNVDLYGIGVVSSSASPDEATTYVDGVNPGSNQDAHLLQDNLLTPSMIDSSAAGSQIIPVTSANIASFVQALYDGGAQPGEYAFLTLAHDGAITAQRYYVISSADSTSYPTPVITIESSD